MTATSTTPQQPTLHSAPFLPFVSQAEKGGRERARTLEHPEGYVQDVHAQEMRAGAREGALGEGTGGGGRSPVLPAFGRGGDVGGGEEGGVWGKVKGVVQSVGEGVGRLEEEVWRRVGKE